MTTTVIVFHGGQPSSGRRVSLESTGGILPGGFTQDFYTDSSGRAHVQHKSEGPVKVYVDGNHTDHGTTGMSSTEITVRL